VKGSARTRFAPLAAGLVALCALACGGSLPVPEPSSAEAAARRDAALAAARVWVPPAVPVGSADLGSNPAGDLPFQPDDEVECRFVLREVGGTTPKFYCELPGGEAVKIKYGRSNPELHAEVAASRLLAALGFPADRMFVVRRVRCAGCPSFPFQALRCVQRTGWERACLPRGIDERAIVDFDHAVLERRLPGREIVAYEGQGWGWYELERIDPARGGSPRAEVDALKLMAVVLAHWDNKPGNQRLICPAGEESADGVCAQPLALVQDLGATFGPLKLDLYNWRREPVWHDASTCTVSMKHLPWGGGTFPDARISEGGRRFLLDLLEQLSDAQLRDLFESSRITSHEQLSAEARDPGAWVRAFRSKVDQIRAAGPC